jgi:excisionase family DNA binding protein
MAIKVSELQGSWLTVGQAAHMLGTTRQSVYRMLVNGDMRAALIGSTSSVGAKVRGVWVIERVSVEAYARETGIEIQSCDE